MKSFKNFLVEREPLPTMDGKTTMEYLQANCSKYLSENNDLDRNIMYRGMPFKAEGSVVMTVRKDRKPLDTGMGLHTVMDEWFFEKFGHRARSQGLFVTGDTKQVSLYGERFIIFPVGEYEYIWSPMVRDLYKMDWNKEMGKSKQFFDPLKKDTQLTLDPQQTMLVRGVLERFQYQTDNINDALRTKHEVVMMCDQYVAVPVHLYENDLRYRLEYM